MARLHFAKAVNIQEYATATHTSDFSAVVQASTTSDEASSIIQE